jgi:acylglycerol lipase
MNMLNELMFERHAIGSGRPFSWVTGDGETFPALVWAPVQEPRAVLVCVHGLSGAAHDFSPLGRPLAKSGWIVYAPELRGQGNDPEPQRRGDLPRPENWTEDLQTFVQMVREKHPHAPWFLCGESMGAVIAIHAVATVQDERLRGLLLMAPVIAVDYKLTIWQEMLFRVFARIVPQHRLRLSDFGPQEESKLIVSCDPEYQHYLHTAPHHLESYTLRFARHLGKSIQDLKVEQVPAQLAVLVMASGQDCFIKPERVRVFFEQLPCADKNWALYPEHHHCLLHDREPERVVAEMSAWLEAKL